MKCRLQFFININVIIIAAKYEEFCRIDDSCQVLDSKTLCDKNLNVCKCNPIYAPDPTSSGHQTRCIGIVYLTFLYSSIYEHPTMIIIHFIYDSIEQ